MKAKDLTLRVVNEIDEGMFEIKEFKPYMSYESFIGYILGDAEILRPTGLKDKNGKEIFEGDILEDSFKNGFGEEFKSERYNVELVDGCWCFIGERINDCREVNTEIDLHNHFFTNELDFEYYDEVNNLKDFEVVGNIYENPNLLK